MRVPIGPITSLEHGEGPGVFRAFTPMRNLGVAQVGERVFAFDSQCPHRAADLTTFGELRGDRLRCGVHGHVYDLETGACYDARDCDPKLEELAVFAAEQIHGHLWVDVPEEEEEW